MSKLSQITRKIHQITDTVSDAIENVSKVVVSDSITPKLEASVNAVTPMVINSTKDLTAWIMSMQPSASRNTALLLQSQMQVVNYVNSPALSGMMIDNIVICLYKSVEMTDSDEEKKLLQEAFASLLQGVVFVSEARLHYEIKRNKEESMMILSNANNLLTQSVSNTAILIAQNANASSNGGIPIVNNIVGSKSLDIKAMTQFAALTKREENIAELKKEHNVMLNNLFMTLDKYFEIIGPSIQINGFLSRYVDQLVEDFKESKHKEIEEYISKFSIQWNSMLNEINTSLYQEFDSMSVRRRIQGVANLAKSIVGTKKLPEIKTYEELCHLYDFLKERHSSLMREMSTIKKDIADKQAQASSLGVFRAGMKHAISSNVGELIAKTKELKISLSDLDEKMRIVENVIMPIKKSVEDYSSNLNRISEQFLISKRRKK